MAKNRRLNSASDTASGAGVLHKTKNLIAKLIAFGVMMAAAPAAYAAAPTPWQIGLQPAAGSIAEKAADLHNMLLIIITVITVFVLALLIYVGMKFHESKNPTPSKTTHNAMIEVLWTVIPVIILVIIAVPSFKLLYYMDANERTDMTIKVTAAQWYWNYQYPSENIAFDSYIIDEADLKEGQKRLLEVDNPLVLPEGKRVKILVESNDVLHSFFVPSMAIQTYTVPGQTNELWVDLPMGETTYYGQCNQICGTNHAYMPIVIKVVSEEKYQKWLEGAREEFADVEIDEPLKIALANISAQ